jgi:hypothetical protein
VPLLYGQNQGRIATTGGEERAPVRKAMLTATNLGQPEHFRKSKAEDRRLAGEPNQRKSEVLIGSRLGGRQEIALSGGIAERDMARMPYSSAKNARIGRLKEPQRNGRMLRGDGGRATFPGHSKDRILIILFLFRAALSENAQAPSPLLRFRLIIPVLAHSSPLGCRSSDRNQFGRMEPSSRMGMIPPESINDSGQNAWFHRECMVPRRMHGSTGNA